MRCSWPAITTLMAVLLTGSACQPLNGSSDAGGTPITNTTTQPGPTGTTSAPSGNATTTAGTGGDDTARFCALAKRAGIANLEVFDAQSTTPEELHQALVNIDDLTAAAPTEIHADFVRFDKFEHALFDAGGNATGDLAQEAGGQELRDALDRISAYLQQHCGIG